MEQRSNDVTLTVAKLAALFASLAAAAYATAQIAPSPIIAFFVSGGPLLAVILWLQKDARRTWRLTTGLFALIGAAYVTRFSVAYVIWRFRVGA